MARPRKGGVSRRVQLRIDPDVLGVFDLYSPDQLSRLVNRALTEIDINSPLGAEMTSVIRPNDPISKIIARLSLSGTTVRILFPEKRDDFREVVKLRHGFVWNAPFWEKEFSEADLCDRSAEVAHALLDAGFIVQSEYSGITQLAVDGSFTPESLRMIKARTNGVYKGWLAVDWPRAEDYYDEAMALTGAKWDKPSRVVLVPPEMYEEVEDFAETFDFSYSDAARQSISSMKSVIAMGFVPSKAPSRKQRKTEPVPTNDIPESLLDD